MRSKGSRLSAVGTGSLGSELDMALKTAEKCGFDRGGLGNSMRKATA